MNMYMYVGTVLYEYKRAAALTYMMYLATRHASVFCPHKIVYGWLGLNLAVKIPYDIFWLSLDNFWHRFRFWGKKYLMGYYFYPR